MGFDELLQANRLIRAFDIITLLIKKYPFYYDAAYAAAGTYFSS